jgi:DNA-binding transcriptional ArsR family regulator
MSKRNAHRILSDEELDRVALHFRVLGEPMRLKILQAVCQEPRTVNEIVEAVGATQANVSKHLALMAAAGILRREKAGQRVYYGMKDQLAVKMCELVHGHLVNRSRRNSQSLLTLAPTSF